MRQVGAITVVTLAIISDGVLASGDLSWNLVVTSQLEANDSWTLVPDGVENVDAVAIRNEVRASLVRETELTRMEVITRGGRQIFDDDRLPDDIVDYTVNVNLLHRKERGGSSIALLFDERSSLLQSFSQESVVDVDNNLREYSARFTEYRELTPVTLGTFSLSVGRQEFDSGNTLVSQDDTTVYGASISVSREVSESTQVGLAMLADLIESGITFPLIIPPFVLDVEEQTRSVLYGPGLTLDHEFTPKLTLSSSFSLRRRNDEFDTVSLLGRTRLRTDDLDYFGSVRLSREMPLGSWSIALARSFRPSESRLVNVTLRDVASFDFQRRLSEGLSAELSGSVFRDERDAPGIGDREAWEARGTLRWAPTLRLAISSFYQYQSESQEFPGIALDADRSIFALSISYSLGTRD